MDQVSGQKCPARKERAAIPLTTLFVLSMMSGCGGQATPDKTVQRPSLLAAHGVVPAETPNLYRCLSELGDALQKAPGRAQVSLTCASGTYSGQTIAGRPCELQIDGENSDFKFTVDGQVVQIRYEEVGHASNGTAIHNLADASAPSQPGIQLQRFTGAPVPLTETLILRFAGALPALPQMVYQRWSGSSVQADVLCRFGA